jgi:5'-nucleotidase/2',3'-cyclic phosphodiesterase and related esterases
MQSRRAANVVKELQGKVDLIVALTHQNIGRDWVIARKVRGIDVIISGHDKQKVPVPYIADNTRIVQAGEKGQYLGHMEISVQPDGSKSYRNSLVPLGKAIPDDSEIKSMIRSYYKKLAALYGPKEQGPDVPLRAATCEACHKDEYAQWKASHHATAYTSLAKRERQFDPDCLPCHTTRFNEQQGFSMQSQQRDLIGVQCESCHGLLAEHGVVAGKVSAPKPARDQCLKCHTAERSPGFEKDYPAYLKRVKH